MSQQSKTTLQSTINTQIADNTSGDISAADIRDNLINITDSLLFNTGSGQAITGSLIVTGGITGSLQGTATTASYVQTAQTASFLNVGTYSITSSWAVSASQALTASQATSASYALSSSFATTAGTATLATNATTAGTAGLITFYPDPSDINYAILFTDQISPSNPGVSAPLYDSNVNVFTYNPFTNRLSLTGSLVISAGSQVVIMTGLPTAEPTSSGQLWLSGSTSNSKFLCVRN